METAMMAGLLAQPGLVLLLAIAVTASVVLGGAARRSPNRLSRGQLLGGHAAAALVAICMAAASTYVSPEEAATRWHVSAENYWSVLVREFISLTIVLVWCTSLGISVVGIPVVLALAHRGIGTTPWVLAASVLVSAVTMLLFVLVVILPNYVPGATYRPGFWSLGLLMIGTHLVLSLGFCVGARLPWTFKRQFLV
jgi:hypothetical protein